MKTIGMVVLPVKTNKTLMTKPKEREIYEMTDREFKNNYFKYLMNYMKTIQLYKIRKKN